MCPQILLIVLLGYLVGSIPFSYLIARGVKGIDLRKVGSGNVGASNVAREVGRVYGLLAGILDFGKSAAVALVLRALGYPITCQVAAGLAAVAGHNWTVFLRFSGGRGIAATLGLYLVLIPRLLLPALAIVAFFGLVLRETALGVLLMLLAIAAATLVPALNPYGPWATALAWIALGMAVLRRVQFVVHDRRQGRPLGRALWNRLLYDTAEKQKLPPVP